MQWMNQSVPSDLVKHQIWFDSELENPAVTVRNCPEMFALFLKI